MTISKGFFFFSIKILLIKINHFSCQKQIQWDLSATHYLRNINTTSWTVIFSYGKPEYWEASPAFLWVYLPFLDNFQNNIQTHVTTYSKDMKPTYFLKELLHIDSISGTSLDENSCNWFSKLLSFLHRNFPVKEKDTTSKCGCRLTVNKGPVANQHNHQSLNSLLWRLLEKMIHDTFSSHELN